MSDAPLPARHLPVWYEWVKDHLPGVTLAVILSIAAHALAARYGAPVMLLALLLGMSVSFLGDDLRIQRGAQLVARSGLKLGVVLMAFRVSLDQLVALGSGAVLLVVTGSGTTILLGLLIGRRVGLSVPAALVASGAVAICGASAALALSSVTPDFKGKQTHVPLVILSATALSTVAMILYPLLLGPTGLTEQAQGIVLGASIHDVAQVIGAGFSVSEAAGQTATLVKMLRVTLLPLLLVVLALSFRDTQVGQARTRLPWFVPAFLAVMVINHLLDAPEPVITGAHALSSSLLVAAVAALGISCAPAKLLSAGGGQTTALMVALSLWLLALAAAGAVLVGML